MQHAQAKQKQKLQEQHVVTLSYEREQYEDEKTMHARQYFRSFKRFIDANGLLTYGHGLSSSDSLIRNDSFLRNLKIDESQILLKEKQVMCLMSFKLEDMTLYKSISQACMSTGFIAKRSDDKFREKDILRYIVTLILESKYIVATIDSQNSNVAFELGLAEAYGKQIIRIANMSNLGEIPFDYKSQERTIFYSDPIDLGIKLSRALLSLENKSND